MVLYIYIFRSYANQIKQQRLFKRGNMKLNTCFENSGVDEIFSKILYELMKKKRRHEFGKIYYQDGKELAIKNSRAIHLYVKRNNALHNLRIDCANSFQKMFVSMYAYVIFTEHKDERYDFSQQLKNFSKLFGQYKKETIKLLKDLETFQEFKFDNTLKEEIFSLEFGKIKTRDKMDEFSDEFYKELFDQK